MTGSGATATLLGQLNVGDAGGGTLIVSNQATVLTGDDAALDPTEGLDIARLAGGSGDATVTGASAWLGNVGRFVVGDAGVGALAILAGGAVSTTPGSAPGLAGLVIANTASASGSSVDVSGAGSTLGVAGALIVGGAGYGALSLSQGGVVTAASLDAASGLGGDGVISVAGTGSALTLTGSLTVGDQGAGEVSVLNGATVSALDVTIGNASTLSSGNVDVEGAGSELFVGTGGVLNVGVAGGGSGVLTIGAGTTLHSNAGVIEAGHASFNNNGGVVDPPFVDITTQSNSGLGSNLYDLYVENIGAVQIVSGTGTWDTPMLLTGTSVADAQNNIDVNGDQGEWQLSSGGTLIVNANTVDSGQAIVFEDATDTLVIGQIVNNGAAGVSGTAPVVEPGAENLLQAGGFAAAIWGYQTGDDIDFANMTVSSASVVNGNTVDLFGPGAVSLGALAFFTKSGSKASDAGAAAAALQIPVQCFAEGTRIATADGPVRVEALRVGDRVVLADGWTGRAGAGSGARIDGAARPRESAPIVWLGHRAVNCRAHPKPETVWPVRVAAGAFGAGVPARDLYLSPDHAVFVNGVLVPVRLLLDGTRIARARRDHVRYFHVELPRHAVILAEGLTVESYLDTGARADFHHDRGTIRLFPDFAERLAAAEAWETRGAAKLVVTGADLAAARRAVAGMRAIPEDARADDDRAAVRG